MKLGILTFHSQLNYGGVLQCWALKTVLEDMGYEVVVIDRWLDAKNSCLAGGISRLRECSLKAKVRSIVRMSFGCGDFGRLVRALRTRRFIKGLNLSQYHFVEWREAPSALGVDAIVVGSDQVWHPDCYGGPWVYLLQGAPSIPAISYAASISKSFLQEDVRSAYKEGWSKFVSISCRESSGCELVASLGFGAQKVVDPTLLLDRKEWEERFGVKVSSSNRRKLVCYFMSIDYRTCFEMLKSFAREENCDIVILGTYDGLPLQSLRDRFWKMLKFDIGNRISFFYSAGPRQFVAEIATATWVVTDSFHGVMFSVIFGVNFRFLKPSGGFRASMFDRIDGFVRYVVSGPVYVDSVRDALYSFSRLEQIVCDSPSISSMRNNSIKWLRDALACVRR